MGREGRGSIDSQVGDLQRLKFVGREGRGVNQQQTQRLSFVGREEGVN